MTLGMKFFSALRRKNQSGGNRQTEYPDLVLAVWRDDLRRLKKLSKKPDVLDPDGRTALMAAAIDSKPDAAQILINAGANVDVQDPGGWSALHFAAQSGSLEIVGLLLEAGASVNVGDIHGNTPLGTATVQCRGNGDAIKLLRSRGADPYLENNSGVSPVALARTIGNYDVAQFYDDLK